ncbi:hypothetical protein FRC17_010815 [Serendipita sp. 399]|nr:hypothetical protein FRC17_010815 [Serendipita sp. 399]
MNEIPEPVKGDVDLRAYPFIVTAKLIVRDLPSFSDVSAVEKLQSIVVDAQLASMGDATLAAVVVQGVRPKMIKVEGNPDYAFLQLEEQICKSGNPERLLPWMEALKAKGFGVGWAGHSQFDVKRRVYYNLATIVQQTPKPRIKNHLKREIDEAVARLVQDGHDVFFYTMELGGDVRHLYVTFQSESSIEVAPSLRVQFLDQSFVCPMERTNMYEPLHPFEVVLPQSEDPNFLVSLPFLVENLAYLVSHRYPRRVDAVLPTTSPVDVDDYDYRVGKDLPKSAVQHIRVIDHDHKAIVVLFNTYPDTVMFCRDAFLSSGLRDSFRMLLGGMCDPDILSTRGNLLFAYNREPSCYQRHPGPQLSLTIGDGASEEARSYPETLRSMKETADLHRKEYAALSQDVQHNKSMMRVLLYFICQQMAHQHQLQITSQYRRVIVDIQDRIEDFICLQDALVTSFSTCNDSEKLRVFKKQFGKLERDIFELRVDYQKAVWKWRELAHDLEEKGRQRVFGMNEYLKRFEALEFSIE